MVLRSLLWPSPQIEYFLRKLTEAMGGRWSEERFADYKLQLNMKGNRLTAWELIELLGVGHFSQGMNRQTLSMGIGEVFLELILDVLKQVRQHAGLRRTLHRRVWACSPPPRTLLQVSLEPHMTCFLPQRRQVRTTLKAKKERGEEQTWSVVKLH